MPVRIGAIRMTEAAILQLVADCMSDGHFGSHIVVVVIVVATGPQLQILSYFLPLLFKYFGYFVGLYIYL